MSATAQRLLKHDGLRLVLDLLDRDGEEARVVGGAVRNALMGRPTTDFDVTTTTVPALVIERAKAAGLRSVPTGIAHGTVTLLVEGRPFEVTTLREDIETDGRHAKIRFGRDFAADARRRDFTINALSMGRDGMVHDYTDGLADITAGRVRFIGEPATRIREDYLRILRFFRFSADYASGAFDAAGLAACAKERSGLAHLSRERIRQELLKLLGARRAVYGVSAMADAGLLVSLLQSVPQPVRLARLISLSPDADVVLRLAALAAVVPEDAERLQAALRLSKAETSRIACATRAREALRGPPLPGRLREVLFIHGRAAAAEGLSLAWAETGAASDAAAWRSAVAFLRDTPEPHLPFSASDLVSRGIAAGKPLGEALKRLQAQWIRAGFPSDPRRLAALLDDVTRG